MEELGIDIKYCPSKGERDKIFELCDAKLKLNTFASTDKKNIDFYTQEFFKCTEKRKQVSKVTKGIFASNLQAISWADQAIAHSCQTPVQGSITDDNLDLGSIHIKIIAAFAKEEAKLCQKAIDADNIMAAKNAAERAVAFAFVAHAMETYDPEDKFRNSYWNIRYKEMVEDLLSRHDKIMSMREQIKKVRRDYNAELNNISSDKQRREILDHSFQEAKNLGDEIWKYTAILCAKSIVTIGTLKSFFLFHELQNYFHTGCIQERECKIRTTISAMLLLNMTHDDIIAVQKEQVTKHVLRRLRSVFVRALKMHRESVYITKKNEEASKLQRHIRETCNQDKARKDAKLALESTPLHIAPIVGRCAMAVPTESEAAAVYGKKVESIRAHKEGLRLAKEKMDAQWAMDRARKAEQQRCLQISCAINDDK